MFSYFIYKTSIHYGNPRIKCVQYSFTVQSTNRCSISTELIIYFERPGVRSLATIALCSLSLSTLTTTHRLRASILFSPLFSTFVRARNEKGACIIIGVTSKLLSYLLTRHFKKSCLRFSYSLSLTFI